MRRSIKMLSLMCCMAAAGGQIGKSYAQDLLWAKSIGGKSSERCHAMKVDAQHNTYVTGFFSDKVDFNPGLHPVERQAYAPAGNVFVAKYDPSGKLLWAASLEGGTFSYGTDISVDRQGNVYLTGTFANTVDFDPGPGRYEVASSAHSQDVFILKLDAAGAFQWVRTIGDERVEEGVGILADDNGAVYATGYFAGKVDFDPGSNVYELTSKGPQDMFVLKLDEQGRFIWALGYGAVIRATLSAGIARDAQNRIYIGGNFTGEVNFGTPTNPVRVTAVDDVDMFLLCLSPSGATEWARGYGGNGMDILRGMAVDHQGDILLTGSYGGSPNIGPGSLTTPAASYYPRGDADAFMLRADELGNIRWTILASSTPGTDIGEAVACDEAGNAYFTGTISGNTSFTSGSMSRSLVASGASDAYILKAAPDGSIVWLYGQGGVQADEGLAIAVDPYDNIYTAGIFSAIMDADPGSGNYQLTSKGIRDVYVQKLAQRSCTGGISSHVFSASACGSYWFAGNSYVTSGTYSDTVLNRFNCDSIITLSLVVYPVPDSVLRRSACDSFMYLGRFYSESGLYRDTFVTSHGCDSFFTLDLTIFHTDSSRLVRSVCRSFFLDGEEYTKTGVYRRYFQGAAGCDSVVTLDLTVEDLSAQIEQYNNVLSTPTVAGATYQWYDCGAARAVSGATLQSFTAEDDGAFAVIVTRGGCSDTSACISVEKAGTPLLEGHEYHSIYPNPFRDLLWISSSEAHLVIIRDLYGREVGRHYTENGAVAAGTLPEGIYTAELFNVSGEMLLRKKLLKSRQ